MNGPGPSDYIAIFLTVLPATIAAIGALIASIMGARSSRRTRTEVTHQGANIAKLEERTNGMQAVILADARIIAHSAGHAAGIKSEKMHSTRRRTDGPNDDYTQHRATERDVPPT